MPQSTTENMYKLKGYTEDIWDIEKEKKHEGTIKYKNLGQTRILE